MPTRTWRSLVLILGETALLIAAVLLGSYVRIGDATWVLLSDADGVLRVALIVVVCQVCLHYADLYDLRGITDTRDLLVRLFQALGATSLILAGAYFWFPDWIIGRGVFVVSAVLAITFVVSWRLVFRWLTKRAAPRERLLLVGTSQAAIELARELYERREELGVEIVGFVDSEPSRVGAPVINPGVVGTIDDIPALIPKFGVDRVVVSLSDARGKLPVARLLDIRLRNGVTFDHLASVYEEYTGKIAVENLRPSWLIFSDGFRKTHALVAAKRGFDVVAATLGLILAAPIMLTTAALVRRTSHGPVLYHQERVGLNGKTFMVHKFRTMRQDAEVRTGPVWSQANDTRVTSIGKFLRRTRLDELPQLWNVLLGEMSFVGPRPERPGFVEQLTADIPFYGQRHVVKPGLTGWAQIRYTYGASVEDAIQKLQYDLYYIKNLSLALDLVIVLETIKTVVLRRGAR
ncbi:MAG TPA: TIGR03013 family XrtA/PEP-CTERM system glycosyltransferase [Vicinamibacterales bacterium]|nr:TIGR03013 family XrtA/PEP-CTERM system glycosyltransferase [Vicinamibacterales bacterium]